MTLMCFSRLGKSDVPTGQQPRDFHEGGFGFAVRVSVGEDGIGVLDDMAGGASEST